MHRSCGRRRHGLCDFSFPPSSTILPVKMATAALFALMLLAPPFASGSSNAARHSTLARRSNVPPEGYFDPMDTGGSMLTVRRPVTLLRRVCGLKLAQYGRKFPGRFLRGLENL